MTGNYLLFCLFGILTYYISSTIAHEAIIDGFNHDHGIHLSYLVSVQFRDQGHVCGGGILGARFILTAAHCVLNRTRQLHSTHISVLAGTSSLNRTGPPAVTVRVEKVFFPKEFHPTVEFSHGDIAVLRLVHSLPLEHSESLRKLHMPGNYRPANSLAVIGGFGWNEYDNGVGYSNGFLRINPTDILPNHQCEEAFPQGAIQSDAHLCARHSTYMLDTRFGVCFGDDGGPLVQHKQFVIGILSRIPNHCDELEQPAIYTRITSYVGMIVNVMQHDRDPSMISLDA